MADSKVDGLVSILATEAADGDLIVFYDTSTGVTKSMSRLEFLKMLAVGSTTGYAYTSNGDGVEPTFQELPAGIGAVISTQTFTASGTWSKPSSGSIARIRIWGGGASGAQGQNTDSGSGGGGGAYFEIIVPLSMLGATEAASVGLGGAAATAALTNGNDGGLSSFGNWGYAAGGSGGTTSAIADNEGGGGARAIYEGGDVTNVALGGLRSTRNAESGIKGGGAGGAGVGNTDPSATGGDSEWGGAGGGGANTFDAVAEPGGTSTNGGDGGDGGYDAVDAIAGTQPAGGGGGSETGNSGAGADGQITVDVY